MSYFLKTFQIVVNLFSTSSLYRFKAVLLQNTSENERENSVWASLKKSISPSLFLLHIVLLRRKPTKGWLPFPQIQSPSVTGRCQLGGLSIASFSYPHISSPLFFSPVPSAEQSPYSLLQCTSTASLSLCIHRKHDKWRTMWSVKLDADTVGVSFFL